MKVLLLIPLLALACAPRSEPRTVHDAEGRIRVQLERVAGKKEGTVRFLNADGTLRTEGHYKADSRNGAWTTVGPTGDTLSILQFNLGKKEGWQAYWAANGQLLRMEHFHDGEPDGPLYRFFSDGTPRQYTEYKAGIAEGAYMEWYKSERNATGRTTGGFNNGKRSGYWHWSYGNGKPAACGEYVNGERTGPWLKWAPDGRRTELTIYPPKGKDRRKGPPT